MLVSEVNDPDRSISNHLAWIEVNQLFNTIITGDYYHFNAIIMYVNKYFNKSSIQTRGQKDLRAHFYNSIRSFDLSKYWGPRSKISQITSEKLFQDDSRLNATITYRLWNKTVLKILFNSLSYLTISFPLGRIEFSLTVSSVNVMYVWFSGATEAYVTLSYYRVLCIRSRD